MISFFLKIHNPAIILGFDIKAYLRFFHKTDKMTAFSCLLMIFLESSISEVKVLPGPDIQSLVFLIGTGNDQFKISNFQSVIYLWDFYLSVWAQKLHLENKVPSNCILGTLDSNSILFWYIRKCYRQLPSFLNWLLWIISIVFDHVARFIWHHVMFRSCLM